MRPLAGDILKVYCAKKFLWHFGIYTQYDTVIDMAPRKGIAERTWSEFSEGYPVYIVPREHGDLPRREVLNRAWNSLGNISYHLIFSNCEHFVNWCRKGKMRSRQLVVGMIVVVAIIIIIYIAYKTLSNKNKK